MDAIVLKNVSKRFTFKTHKGFKGFFNPDKKEVHAVDGPRVAEGLDEVGRFYS